jgi:DNA transformation protein
MSLSPGFTDFVIELIAGFGKVEVKRMFGGAMLLRGGVGFGILDDDTFFLKADAAMGAELKKQRCRPWSYSVKKDGTVRDIAYWSLPDTAADDPDEAVALVRRSFAIAAQAAKDKVKKTPVAKKAPAKKAAAKPRAKK